MKSCSIPIRTVTAGGPALPMLATGKPALQLHSIAGGEHLSKISRYTLDFVTPSNPAVHDVQAANYDLDAMLGKELTVTILLDHTGSSGTAMGGYPWETREISGIVTGNRFVGQTDCQCRYQLVIQPWLHLADQRSDYRIFQNRSVVEIVDEVLQAYPYSYEKRLGSIYPPLLYQVQYGETDYAFIQRLMSEHGIYWFFEHSANVHRMVLVDHPGAHRRVDCAAYHTLPYYPSGCKTTDREHVDTISATHSIQSGRWTTSDFDFEKPDAWLEANNALPQNTAHNDLERYEWPGDYVDPSQGEQFARVRMEEVRSHSGRARGTGKLRDVVCGTTFRLEGHPQHAANQEYLVIGAWLTVHENAGVTASGECSFQCSFHVQPATTVYRASRSVSRPRTTGPQTAIVTGPPGQEIWTDQYGRVKLKFHWDRSPARDHTSSCWIRVSYPWAGSSFGGINIPRVGTEVIVDFENGDPDRPIIVGRVYNAATMPPWALPFNATQSGLISRSLTGGTANANAIRFEDLPGAEELWLQAERDMRIEVENDEDHSVLANRTKSVNGDETTSIGGTRTETVTGDETLTLQANRQRSVAQNDTLDIGGDQQTTISGSQRHDVGASRDESVGRDHSRSVVQNDSVDIGGDQRTAVNGSQRHAVQRDHDMTIGENSTLSISGDRTVDVSRTITVSAQQSATWSAQQRLTLQCGQATIVLDNDGTITINGTKLNLSGSSSIALDSSLIDLN